MGVPTEDVRRGGARYAGARRAAQLGGIGPNGHPSGGKVCSVLSPLCSRQSRARNPLPGPPFRPFTLVCAPRKQSASRMVYASLALV